MELSILLSTPPWPSSTLPPQPLSTLTSCRTSSCNSACRMATRETARQRSTTLSTRHNRSYLQRDLVKRVWGDRLGRTLGPRPRDHKHLSRGHIQAFKGPSTVVHIFKELHHTRRPSNTQAVMPAFPHRCRTSSSTHRPCLIACPPCPHCPSPLLSRTSALGRHPRIRITGAESTPLRMELHHMYRGCLTVAAHTSPSTHRSPPILLPLHRLNSASLPRTFTNSNNNNACMRYDSGSSCSSCKRVMLPPSDKSTHLPCLQVKCR